MGYHSRLIQKGVLGTPSKIKEEYEEFLDALEQGNSIMALLELSDLMGAIESYAQEKHKISFAELMKMTRATQSAFKDGSRK